MSAYREVTCECVKKISDRAVSSSLVQICADKAVIERRITAFINRKREEVNYSNKREFCGIECESAGTSRASITNTMSISNNRHLCNTNKQLKVN